MTYAELHLMAVGKAEMTGMLSGGGSEVRLEYDPNLREKLIGRVS